MYSIEIKTNENVQILHCPYDDINTLNSGTVTLSLNAINNFNFSILPTHPLFKNGIVPFLSIITIKRDNEIVFRGRVVDRSLRMGNDGFMMKEYVAECELAYLLDSIQPAREIRRNVAANPSAAITGNILRDMLNHHNSRVNPEKRIEFAGTDVVDFRMAHVTTYENTWANIKRIVTALGGYLSVEYGDVPRLRYMQNIGEQSKMSIKLAENMQSISSDYTNSETFTRLIPLGSEIVEDMEFVIGRLVAKNIILTSGTTFTDRWWLGVIESYSSTAPGLADMYKSLLCDFAKLNYHNPLRSNVIFSNRPQVTANRFDTAMNILRQANMPSIVGPFSPWTIEVNGFGSDVTGAFMLIIRAAENLNVANPISPFDDLPKSRLTLVNPNFIRIGDEDSNNIIERVEIFNDANNVNSLRQYAENWLSQYTTTNSATIGAADLSLIDESCERFKIGNTYKAENEILGINKFYRLVEQNINIVNPAQSSLTFGTKQTTLSNINN